MMVYLERGYNHKRATMTLNNIKFILKEFKYYCFIRILIISPLFYIYDKNCYIIFFTYKLFS